MDIKKIEKQINEADLKYKEAVAEIDENNYAKAIDMLGESKEDYQNILNQIDESDLKYKNIVKSLDEIIEQCDEMIQDCKQFVQDRAHFDEYEANDFYPDDLER